MPLPTWRRVLITPSPIHRRRDAGGAVPRSCRPRLVDEFLPKIEVWVEASKGKIRADAAHDSWW